MPSEYVLRRKVQQKAKRRRFSRCSLCGEEAVCHVEHKYEDKCEADSITYRRRHGELIFYGYKAIKRCRVNYCTQIL